MIPNQENILDAVRLVDHPTPFFYTSRPVLKHNYHTFTQLFDGSEVYYAVKANSDPLILGYLAQIGCGFEAASSYEIDLLLKLGVDPAKIIYGTSVKPPEHIKHAAANGIERFAADSQEELEKLAEHAPGSKVFIRTIVDDTGSVFTFSERFGAPIETVKGLILWAKHLELKTYALYEAMIHQGLTQYNVHPFIEQKDSEMMHAVLAGPTGDSLDIIAREVELPDYISVGDKLIFENTGAYTVTMASPFNGFPKPELYIS
jgi:diaminopimelate decarboxylase